MRIASFLAFGLFLAPTAFAQDAFEGRGYLMSCGEEGCFLNAAGMDLFVPAGQGADQLAGLPMMAAVEVAGTLSDIGDSSADLSLASARRVADDLYEGNLIAMQGEWQPRGEEAPFRIAIFGMEWSEILNDELADRFMMSVGDSCEGDRYDEMVVTLYRYGDDPAADGCWLVDGAEDTVLTLRKARGADAAVVFDRVSE